MDFPFNCRPPSGVLDETGAFLPSFQIFPFPDVPSLLPLSPLLPRFGKIVMTSDSLLRLVLQVLWDESARLAGLSRDQAGRLRPATLLLRARFPPVKLFDPSLSSGPDRVVRGGRRRVDERVVEGQGRRRGIPPKDPSGLHFFFLCLSTIRLAVHRLSKGECKFRRLAFPWRALSQVDPKTSHEEHRQRGRRKG